MCPYITEFFPNFCFRRSCQSFWYWLDLYSQNKSVNNYKKPMIPMFLNFVVVSFIFSGICLEVDKDSSLLWYCFLAFSEAS